jgi:dihydrofolate reductase
VPRIRYLVTMSLDGYIAGPRGEVDWIVPEPAVDFAALFAQFDTFLIGRRTFDLMRQPGSPPLPPGSKTFVFSRTLKGDFPGVSILDEVSPSAIARIKAETKKDIWLFGGGELFRSLLSQGLVDTVEVKIMPVLLGGGQQLLPQPARRAQLQLTDHRVYPSGIVSAVYAVAAQPAQLYPYHSRSSAGSGSSP